MSLDDVEQLKDLDASGMLRTVENFAEQCRQALRITETVTLPEQFLALADKWQNVVVAGMGGSAIGGDLVKAVVEPYLKIPLVVQRHYNLPAFVNEQSLVFACSYSGTTEETISAFNQALEKGAKLIGITSGGELSRLLTTNNLPWVQIPGGLQPRAALGYLFFPVLFILSNLQLMPFLKEDISETIMLLDNLSDLYAVDVPSSDNLAKQIAEKVAGKIPVVYGSHPLGEIAAYRWKCQINENSKSPAFWHYLPEQNHNEITGWQNLHKLTQDNFVLIWLKDPLDLEQVKKREKVTIDLISSYFAETIEIKAQGKSALSRLLSLIYLGDFVSVYLAFLYQTDPSPVERIQQLKKALQANS